jgi:hypothetical protein
MGAMKPALRRIAGLSVPLVLLAGAVPAFAERTPTKSENRGIVSAIERVIASQEAPAARRAHVENVVVSSLNARWARAEMTAKNLDTAMVVLQRRGSTWKVRNWGTAMVMCGIGMPKKVQAELFPHEGCGHR